MNEKASYIFLNVSVFAFVFFSGYYARMLHIDYINLNEEKKQLCTTKYKKDPVATLASDYCNDFFEVLRGNKKTQNNRG